MLLPACPERVFPYKIIHLIKSKHKTMNKKKAIYYPAAEGQVSPYYDNLADALAGALGVKYGTAAGTITKLNGHKTNVPLRISEAFALKQQAQLATDAKNAELDSAKIDALLEVVRITNLPTWDENDAEALGIRVVKNPTDLNTVKPKAKATPLPQKNVIDWLKIDMDGVIIECIVEPVGPNPNPPTQTDPNWQKIGEDQRSPYEDKRPTTNGPEIRYYRLQYVFDENRVGLFSDIIPVITNISL